jgi:integrase
MKFNPATASGLESPPFRFHDLRHTFGTLAVQVWPLVDVQNYMGHANVTTTMIYAHHVPKRDAADALTRLLTPETTCPDHALARASRERATNRVS